MKKNVIKEVLFSLASILSAPALAHEFEHQEKELILVEELPPASRAVVYEHVLKFLKDNESVVQTFESIALDRKGNVYVFDKRKAGIVELGQPSCVSSGD